MAYVYAGERLVIVAGNGTPDGDVGGAILREKGRSSQADQQGEQAKKPGIDRPHGFSFFGKAQCFFHNSLVF
jgi:hypothetical protein